MDFLGWVTGTKEFEDHMALGEALAAEIEGFEGTLDAYGQGPSEHGSAWKAPGDQLAALGEFLLPQGFWRKKNNFLKGKFLVEVGLAKDKSQTFVFISDDNA